VIQSAFLRYRSERSRTYATLSLPPHVPSAATIVGMALADDWRSGERNAVLSLHRSTGSRFAKSDDNVGSTRDARAPAKNPAYADLL
jgi:hypothetical protein